MDRRRAISWLGADRPIMPRHIQRRGRRVYSASDVKKTKGKIFFSLEYFRKREREEGVDKRYEHERHGKRKSSLKTYLRYTGGKEKENEESVICLYKPASQLGNLLLSPI